MARAQLTLAALLVAGGLWLLFVSLRAPAAGVADAAAESGAALERRVGDAAQHVLSQGELRGSRLVAVHCNPRACEVEAAHQDRAALASFQQYFPHRMGALFAQSSIRSDAAALRSHVSFARKGERSAPPPH